MAISAARKRYRATRMQAIRDQQTRWRKAHPGKSAEYAKRYRAAHPERVGAWKRANPACDREWKRRYHQDNRELYTAYQRNYVARKANAEGSHDVEDIALICEQQEGRCWYCGEDVQGAGHIDHQIPLSRGGSNGPENLVLSCASCNLHKHTKLPGEFALRLF